MSSENFNSSHMLHKDLITSNFDCNVWNWTLAVDSTKIIDLKDLIFSPKQQGIIIHPLLGPSSTGTKSWRARRACSSRVRMCLPDQPKKQKNSISMLVSSGPPTIISTWLDLTWLTFDLTWLDLTWFDLTWLDLTWLDWLDLTWLDLTWLDLTWLDLTWLDLTWLDAAIILSWWRTSTGIIINEHHHHDGHSRAAAAKSEGASRISQKNKKIRYQVMRAAAGVG